MIGSNFKYTQFVFHELKHAKPLVWPFKYGLSSALPQYVDPQPQLTSDPAQLQRQTPKGPLTARKNCPELGQGRRGHFLEGRVAVLPGWVVLHGEKLATTQDKHKQGHPLGRLTLRACVRRLPAQAAAWGGWCGHDWPSTLVGTPCRWVHPSGKSASACMEPTVAEGR